MHKPKTLTVPTGTQRETKTLKIPKQKTESDEKPVEHSSDTDPVIYKLGEDPDFGSYWRFETLYATDVNGGTRIWWVGFKPITNMMVSLSGLEDGKHRMTEKLIETNKSNRNVHEQAMLKIKSILVLKDRKGYKPRAIFDDKSVETLVRFMAFNKYKHGETKLNFPVGIQPKLDGVRCIAMIAEDGKVSMRSKTGIEWKQESKDFFAAEIGTLLSHLPEGTQLDGEIYGKCLTFEKIVSIVKDSKVMKQHIKEISFNLFTIIDVDLNIPAEERYAMLKDAYNECAQDLNGKIKRIKMNVVNNHEELMVRHLKNVEKQYEGSVIYRYANDSEENSKQWKLSLYKPGKVSNVLKFKTTKNGDEMLEDEAEIIGIEEAKGAQEGAAIFVVRKEGKEFSIVPAMTIERRREIFLNSSEFIGKMLTYKYQNLSDKGIPRFATGKEIRDYE